MKFSTILIAGAIQQTLAAAVAITEPEVSQQLQKRYEWDDSYSLQNVGLLSGTTILYANCQEDNGSYHYTELELNICFNNNNGIIYVSS